jgi:hypothetical protein
MEFMKPILKAVPVTLNAPFHLVISNLLFDWWMGVPHREKPVDDVLPG